MLLAVALSALFAATACDFSVDYRDRAFCWDVDVGESILHGLNVGNEGAAWWQMPSGATLNALLCNHAPPSASVAALLLMAALYPLLVFALGLQLHSPAAGLLAAAASTGVLWVLPDETMALQFGLLATAVAVTAAWRASNPDRRRTLALAAAVGVSVLVRSSLFLFPILLLAGECLDREGKARREKWRLLAAVAAILLLFVIPWAAAGKLMTGTFNLFEWDWPRPSGTPAPIYAGHAAESFVAAAGRRGFHSAYAWAAEALLRNPLDYGAAVLARCLAAARMRPWLFAAAAAAFWYRRRDAAFQVVGALALALLVAENLIELREIHMVAVWPPLLALAAAAAMELLGVARVGLNSVVGIRIAAATLLPYACMAALSGAALLRYPRRGIAPDPAVLAREIGKHPRDPYLRSLRGRVLLRRGMPAEAASDLAAALARQPSKRRELDYAVALALQGGESRGLVDAINLDRLPTRLADHWERVAALKALASLFHGDLAAARSAAAAGGLLETARDGANPDIRSNGEIFTMLRTCGTLPEFWPPAQRLAMFERLSTWERPDHEFFLYMAQTAESAGRRDKASALRRSAAHR